MAEKLVCPICGEPTRVYMGNARRDRLCSTHADKLKAGEIALCEDCGKYYNIDQGCSCKAQPKYTELPRTGFTTCVKCGTTTKGYAFCKECWSNYDDEELLELLNKKFSRSKSVTLENKTSSQNEIKNTELNPAEEVTPRKIIIDQNTKSRCITCGIKTDGLLFCGKCYYKYKDKELLFKVEKCGSIELLDESYEGIYTCSDGHVVKSKSERDIDNYLYQHGIPHAYELEIYCGTDKMTPDFYLPNYLGPGKHVYLEHWGYNENNYEYQKTKKWKMERYIKMGITLVATFEQEDANKIESRLGMKLDINNIVEGRINFDPAYPIEKQ